MTRFCEECASRKDCKHAFGRFWFDRSHCGKGCENPFAGWSAEQMASVMENKKYETTNENQIKEQLEMKLTEIFGKPLEENATESNDFSPVPAGRYTLEIDDVNPAKTNKNNKTSFSVKFKIVGPSHEGRLIFCDYYYGGVSDKCASISFSSVSQLSRCAFGKAVDNHEDMIGGRVDADVVVETKPGYPARNVVRRYHSPSAALSASAAPSVREDSEEIPF